MPEVTIVIPVYNEEENIATALERISQEVTTPHCINIIYDFDEDNTIPVVESQKLKYKTQINLIKNKYTKGVLNAIKTGLETAQSEFVIVTMADLSDPPSVINEMIKVAKEKNADIVCGSRYMKGGKQIGGPFLKGLMSRFAGLSLHFLTQMPTCDATNSFKLYRKSFLEKMQIESTGGFELGIELVAKAHVEGYKICEVPTIWTDRVAGQSNFKLFSWLPSYLKWYFYAFNKKVPSRFSLSENQISTFSWLVLGLTLLINFIFILKGTINIPYWDEWEMVDHLGKFDLSWLFAYHNEHRIVFTKLLTLILAKINGWNLYTNVAINYILLIITAGFLYKIIKPAANNLATLPLYFLPIFSTLNCENLARPFQSQFHFMILFGLIAVIFGFLKENNVKNQLIFSFFLICSMFSMSFTFAAGIIIVYIFKEIMERKSVFSKTLLPFLIFVSALGAFFIGSQQQLQNYGYRTPWHITFWKFFTNLFSVSTLGTIHAITLQMAITFVLVFLSLSIIFKKENIKNKNIQALLAIFAASCVSLAAITLGRAQFGIVVSLRHTEIGLILIPIIATLFYSQKIKNGKNLFLIYTLFLIIGFLPYFKFTAYSHDELNFMRKSGVSCVENFYKYNSQPYCWTIYPRDLRDKLIEAKRINLSFTKEGDS